MFTYIEEMMLPKTSSAYSPKEVNEPIQVSQDILNNMPQVRFEIMHTTHACKLIFGNETPTL